MSGAGVALGTRGYEVEANAYLQRRLEIIYAFVLGAGALFLAFDYITEWLSPPRDPSWPNIIARIVHFIGIALLGSHYVLLRRRPHGAHALRYFDAFLVIGTLATCLGIYSQAIGYRGAYRLLWIASLLVVGRGIAVPSSVRRTLLLSLAAPAGLFVVRAFRPYEGEDATFQLAWDLIVMGLVVALSTLASRINFRLREAIARARRLGEYQLEEKLGEGAMGTVYRATHNMLRRPTAVKLLRPEIAGEETIARFEREVRETARLEHPNTIRIYDYGRTPEGVFYYAMELLDGEDLKRVLEMGGPMPEGRVVHVLRQVVESLDEAHRQGLVHRDVKLDNIVLCRRAGRFDVVKVLDFGLVKDLRNAGVSVTQVGMLCGTPETIAPEVLTGQPATPSADLYAIGVVGHQLLTGRLPFDANSPAELLAAHLHGEPRPLDGALGALLGRCLAKDPADRPADAPAFLRELSALPEAWSQEEAAAWWRDHPASRNPGGAG